MRETCGVMSARTPRRAARELVDQLAGRRVQVAAGAGQQGVDGFHQGRRDQLETVGAVKIEQFATQFLDAPGLGRK